MSEQTNVIVLGGQTKIIPLDRIVESKALLRAEYPDESLDELADSMTADGLIQPILVQPSEVDDTFELVVGSRRVRAARRRGVEGISALVIERKTPLEILFIALSENLHRTDLNPFEEAAVFLRLMREFSLDLKTIGSRVKKTESYISTRLALLSMPDDVKQLVASGQLGIQFVKALAKVTTGADQARLAGIAVENKLTVTELQAKVRSERDDPQPYRPKVDVLTPLKVQARVDGFHHWIKRVPSRLQIGHLNAQEQRVLSRSIIELETELRNLRGMIDGSIITHRTPTTPPTRSGNIGSEPRNHRDEWPSGDIKRIHDPKRPTDDVLAKELGRSASAIRAMRHSTKK